MSVDELKFLIRTVPDFPSPGIEFRDVTTLIADPSGFATAIALMAKRCRPADMVAGIEARGFIFGAALAHALGCGFVPIRKAGKLPVPALGRDYDLEYGSDRLELDPASVAGHPRVLLVDDLIATGGTAVAAASLLREAGAELEQALFVIDLPELGGAERLREEHIQVEALLAYAGH